MITKNNTVLKITAGIITHGLTAQISSDQKIKNVNWNVTDTKDIVKATGVTDTTSISVTFDAEAWSVENPVLYTFTADITYADGEKEMAVSPDRMP